MKTRQDPEEGFALIVVLALMVPLVITAAAFSSVMMGRSHELRSEHDEEMALLTAEAGVDDAIFRGRIGTLTDGGTVLFNFGPSRTFRIDPTYLKIDGADNDGDGSVDEADEDVFQVIVTGTYRKTKRRLAAYLGPVPLLPTLTSAMATQDEGIEINLKGTPLISGNDTNINGTAGPAPAVPGLTIAPPGTVSDLSDELSLTEQSKVIGVGSAPSLGTSAAIDLTTLVAQLKNIANIVLTNPLYSGYNFGDGSAGTANVTFRDGDVKFSGISRGSGILVVTGDLEMTGTFRFDGVIIVLGEVRAGIGTASVYGSIVQGPGGGLIDTKGTFDLFYSSQAIALANSVSGRYVAFNGWQEISRN